ncbi:MAG: nuclear protein [Pedosphaera sp.]|nr:nuclear protein [Pedosphaera sp.]
MPLNELVDFRNSPIHGTGGFARVDIPNETNVVEYVGRKIDKAESLRQCELENPFIFTLDDQFDLDGNVDWNPARLLNHSCSPNCEALDDEGRIWIVACRDIKAGEEITFNYNYDLVDYKDNPCRCASPNCVGYMVAEEFFPTLLEKKQQAADAIPLPEAS